MTGESAATERVKAPPRAVTGSGTAGNQLRLSDLALTPIEDSSFLGYPHFVPLAGRLKPKQIELAPLKESIGVSLNLLVIRAKKRIS